MSRADQSVADATPYADVPQELRERDQWLLWSEDKGKAPLDADGKHCSWNDPAAWLSFEEASRLADTPEFDGIGFVVSNADPYVALDIDGCLRKSKEPRLKQWFSDLDGIDLLINTWGQYSTSGTGLHVYTKDVDIPEWWNNEHHADHEGIEAYAEKFLIVTGDHAPIFEREIRQLDPGKLRSFLFDAYEAMHGEPPRVPGDRSLDTDTEIGIYDVISRTAYPEGENAAHPFHGSDTGHNFRVDPGGETFRCWRHNVTGNGAHLLGIEQGIIQCGEWASSGVDTETWKEIFDAGRNAGYDIPEPRSEGSKGGGNGPETTTPDPDNAESWADVRALFNSEEQGTTTTAYNAAANLLVENHGFVTVRDSQELYYYNPDLGYYVRKGDTFLEELLNARIPDCVNDSRARNITNRVKARTYVDAPDFTPPKNKVCVENGVLDLETRELEQHSPEYHFTARLQTPYNPEAAAPRWESFLSEAVADQEAKKLEEFIGYCLEAWHHNREKNLFIVGPRQSGKSTFLEVLQSLFGSAPTVTNLTPQQLADTQFDASNLKEAMLNASNDINATKVEDSGTLKRIFSGERIKLERKYQDAHFGAPKAKHAFTANWLPSVIGQDESLYRRVLIVEFLNPVSDAERDKDLKDKLRDELPAVLNRALDARDRLHEQDRFTNDRSTDETRQKWDSWRDAHKRFLYTQFEITGDGDDAVKKREYYQEYKGYAASNGYQLIPQQGVTKSLKWVPEISVHGDADGEYSGLKRRHSDTTEESQQQSLKSQHERRETILELVRDFTDRNGGVDRETVVLVAEREGFNPDKVAHDIDTLTNQNPPAIMEKNGGLVAT